jgi:ribonuclease HI
LSLDLETNFTNFFFHGTYSQEGAGDGCILDDPEGEKNTLSCRIGFECSSSAAYYEALIQRLRKAVDLNTKYLKVYGD